MVTGTTVFITGAGSGLGAALARRFGAEGAHVAVVDMDLDRARAVAAELPAGQGLALAANVCNPSPMRSST